MSFWVFSPIASKLVFLYPILELYRPLSSFSLIRFRQNRCRSIALNEIFRSAPVLLPKLPSEESYRSKLQEYTILEKWVFFSFFHNQKIGIFYFHWAKKWVFSTPVGNRGKDKGLYFFLNLLVGLYRGVLRHVLISGVQQAGFNKQDST